MLARIISAIVLISVALFATIYSSTTFALFIVIMMSLALYELMKLVAKNPLYKLIGIIYIFLGSFALILMRDISLLYVIFPFVVVAFTDTFAFFVGINFGKHKMAPTMSPNKSWEGTIGGIIAGTLIGTAFLNWYGDFSTIGAVILSFECSILAVLGDLLESVVKRKAKVKDTGKLIPGHGGVLDRIDGLIPVSLLVFIWVITLELLK